MWIGWAYRQYVILQLVVLQYIVRFFIGKKILSRIVAVINYPYFFQDSGGIARYLS